ncbi:MAG: beta-galactosidase small subunit [Actinomycetaceae bacterium]|nr:beta-galactosidase small subunit [Actinomycetaceae bacterium]
MFSHLKEATALLTAGHPLGFDECPLATEHPHYHRAAELFAAYEPGAALVHGNDTASPIDVTESGHVLGVSGENFLYHFDRRTGLPSRLMIGGKDLLERPTELNIWRAPTDNDRGIQVQWQRARYDQAYTHAYSCTPYLYEDGVVIDADVVIVAPTVQPIVRAKCQWRIYGDGTLHFTLKANKESEYPTLPRLGLRLFLADNMEQVRYFGLGPHEAYVDKHRSCRHGEYEATVDELFTPYLRPQENGSHAGTDFLIISSGDAELRVAGATPFSFNASRYTQEDMTLTLHDIDLKPCGHIVLCLDAQMAGIGSASCGPDLLEQYRADGTHVNFSLVLSPSTH